MEEKVSCVISNKTVSDRKTLKCLTILFTIENSFILCLHEVTSAESNGV